MSEINNTNTFSSLPQSVQACLTAIPPSDFYLVALSGGLDSIFLLHCVESFLRLHRPESTLKAIHVHHGLSANANAWAIHCQEVCDSLGVELVVEFVKISNAGKGIEAAAREARYHVFEQSMEMGGVLLQGHHRNDQAETVLLRMCKGSAPGLLSAIPHRRVFSEGEIYRPFLGLSREEIQTSARKMGLKWVEDESNQDNRFDRNFIRNEVLPALQDRWPAVSESLARFANDMSLQQDQQQTWCLHALQEIQIKHNPCALKIDVLMEYPVELQRSILRSWLHQRAGEQPSSNNFDRIFSELFTAAEDSQPEIRWGSLSLRRFDGCLHLVATSDLSAHREAICVESRELLEKGERSFPGLRMQVNSVSTSDVSKGGIYLKLPEGGAMIRLSYREGGERIRLPGRAHSSSVKTLLQTNGIPPWRRDQLRFIYVGEELVYLGLGRHSEMDFYASGWQSDLEGPTLSICLGETTV